LARIVPFRIAVPKLLIPPPESPAALLPVKVLLVTVIVAPGLSIAPPKATALLPENVLLVTDSVPLLEMPPPPPSSSDALFPEKVLFVTVTVPLLLMPPPSAALPLAIVRFRRLSVAPELTLKI
jgi:hypothetical protein